jgi:hypothetical protein
MKAVVAAREAHRASGAAPLGFELPNLHEVQNVPGLSLTLRSGFAQAHVDALVPQFPFDVERLGAADPNVDVVAFLETQEIKDLGRQSNGELIVPLFDFHRTLQDCTHVHLDGADSSVNDVLQGA